MRKARLLPHEAALLKDGSLLDVSHSGASAQWLCAPSAVVAEGRALVFRHMGDVECAHLIASNALPATQPYQTITRGEEGRAYCESYLRSNKKVDTHPTTVVEFNCDAALVDHLFAIQHKPEKGCLSHGLGDKAGNTLALFNSALADGTATWRIVLVKRRHVVK